ncbi:MAG: AmmeMemoRadiSam system protein B [Anaerolineaceae bacterium]|nr:AmmeMemoRadiSam system protein B [Anaerolineaceae bacterium]
MMKNIDSVRPSPIAGSWYSSDPLELALTIDAYLRAAKPQTLPGEVVGLVAPHAGHIYSGPVAAYAFKTVMGHHYDHVAVLSPLHPFDPHPVLTSAHSAYETPLGTLPINKDLVAAVDTAFNAKTGLNISTVVKDREHSLEIELPFLQRTLAGEYDLIPIMIRDQSRRVARDLGLALAEALDPDTTLLVASSDLSHFYPEAQANQLDGRFLKTLAEFSPDALFDLHNRGLGQACGLSAIAAVLWAAEQWGADQVTLLNYNTSGAITGDRSSVVGYGAAAITRPI